MAPNVFLIIISLDLQGHGLFVWATQRAFIMARSLTLSLLYYTTKALLLRSNDNIAHIFCKHLFWNWHHCT